MSVKASSQKKSCLCQSRTLPGSGPALALPAKGFSASAGSRRCLQGRVWCWVQHRLAATGGDTLTGSGPFPSQALAGAAALGERRCGWRGEQLQGAAWEERQGHNKLYQSLIHYGRTRSSSAGVSLSACSLSHLIPLLHFLLLSPYLPLLSVFLPGSAGRAGGRSPQ